ncbi:unnamed protein product [Sphenostylis stenocarpa]|uniref:Thioredoxin domain-containing protein n=1 Tax=Sphenostylis stenocarpa TaxID=92480 RepID=A0AA86STM8_9FABA|nr:unnamed protein product [Sphenostylis stenocarpa]
MTNEIARKTPEVISLKVDVDELRVSTYIHNVAEQWSIKAMPTFLFLKEVKLVDKIMGAKKEKLQGTITKHLNTGDELEPSIHMQMNGNLPTNSISIYDDV